MTEKLLRPMFSLSFLTVTLKICTIKYCAVINVFDKKKDKSYWHDYSPLQKIQTQQSFLPWNARSPQSCMAAVTALKVVKQTKTDSRWAPSEHELWRILRLLRWTAFDQPMMVIETSSRSFLPQQLFWSEFPNFGRKLQFNFAFNPFGSTTSVTVCCCCKLSQVIFRRHT